MPAVSEYIIFHLFIGTFNGFKFWFYMLTWSVSLGLSFLKYIFTASPF